MSLQSTVTNAQDDEPIRQWAVSATASSQYDSPDWAAFQATGQPNTHPDCGDIETAWAADDSDTVEWLEVGFTQAVIPTQVNIYETYNGGQATSLDLITSSGNRINVPLSTNTSGNCRINSINFSQNFPPIVGIRINVDQSIYGSWYEVDAVELIGFLSNNIVYPPDNRINWQYGDLGAVFYRNNDSSGNPAIDIYCWDGEDSSLGMQVNEMNMTNGMQADGCDVTFYILEDGVYQFNINYDGKLYEIECVDLECRPPEMRYFDPNE